MMRTSKSGPLVLVVIAVGITLTSVSAQVTREDAGTDNQSGYYPMSVGNWWLYTVGGHSKMASQTIKWRVTRKENLRGSDVFYLSSTPSLGEDTPFMLSRTNAGIIEADTKRLLLKNHAQSGERWSVRSPSLRAPGKLDSFEVISAGKACSAGGHSFHDCVIVREDDEANNVASLTTYARGVGPVKYVYFKGLDSERVDTILTIKSWGVHLTGLVPHVHVPPLDVNVEEMALWPAQPLSQAPVPSSPGFVTSPCDGRTCARGLCAL